MAGCGKGWDCGTVHKIMTKMFLYAKWCVKSRQFSWYKFGKNRSLTFPVNWQFVCLNHSCPIYWDMAFSREFSCPLIYYLPTSCWIVSLSLHIENSWHIIFYSSCWGYSLINTLKLKKPQTKKGAIRRGWMMRLWWVLTLSTKRPPCGGCACNHCRHTRTLWLSIGAPRHWFHGLPYWGGKFLPMLYLPLRLPQSACFLRLVILWPKNGPD